MKSWKLMLAMPLLLLPVAAHAGTPIYSTLVDRALSSMLNPSGKFKEIHWSNGQITRYEDIGGASSDSPTFTGTSTLSGNLDFGSNTVHTYNGGITRRFPASGTETVTNADIYALVGLGPGGNIVNRLGTKVDAVNGSSTGQTLTNPTILGIFTFPGNGFTWDAGSSTLSSNGTMTLKTASGSNANVVLDADGTATHYLRRNNVNFDMRSIPRTLVAGSTTITGTAYGTVATFVIPAGELGTNGMFELYGSFGKLSTDTSTGVQHRFVIANGIGTFTSSSATTMGATSQQNQIYHVFKNNGSTSVNTIQDASGSVFANSALTVLTPNINTANTTTVYLELKATSIATLTAFLSNGFCRYTYIP